MTVAPEVLAIRARPRPASAPSAVLTLGWRAMLKIKQAFGSRNPVTRLASTSRKLMHGEQALMEVMWVLVAAAAIVLVASPIALQLYRKER
jgi:ABC-type polysaccharide/polyol phosphate export permease